MMLTVAHCGCLVLVLSATPPSTRPADAAAESRGLFLQASDLVCEKVVNPDAKQEDKEFAAKVLKFAITGSQKDYDVVAATIDRACKEAMDSGKPKLSFPVNKAYQHRASRYYDIYVNATGMKEAKEALDSIVRAAFYNPNEWSHWACASAAFLDRGEQGAVYDPRMAERYAKVAVALDPRDPYPYTRLVAAYFAFDKFEDSDRIATQALEVGQFEKARFADYRGDAGRAYFNDYKGRCYLRMGDATRARDYLKRALTLGRPAEEVRPYLCEALLALAEDVKPLKISEGENLGFQGKVEQHRHVITQVFDGSPVHAAGLQAGDVFVSVDGLPVAYRIRYDRYESRVIEAREAVLAGKRPHSLLEARRGEQVMLFLLTK